MKSKKKKPELSLEELKNEIDELKDTVASIASRKTKHRKISGSVFMTLNGISKKGMPHVEIHFTEVDEDGYSETDEDTPEGDHKLSVFVEDVPLDDCGEPDYETLADYYFTRLKVKNYGSNV